MLSTTTPEMEHLRVAQPRLHELFERSIKGIEDGVLPSRLFNDAEIYEREKTQVFGKAWIYLGHVTELPNKNDYILRNIVDNSLIVTRGKDGEIRAFLNACAHRGAQICRADSGNARMFRCPYHGWTYANDGRLAGVPQKKEAYGDAINESEWGLVPLPRLEVFQGLIFGCLDPDAMSLDDYLGDMKFYLEMLTNRTAGGLQVSGPPQRWVIKADWKIPADNFVGDSYHTQTAHQSIVELNMLPPDPFYAMAGDLVDAGNGHGMGLTGAPPGVEMPPYLGLPEGIIEQAKSRLSTEQLAIMEKTNFFHSTVFPNFSFLNIMTGKDQFSPLVPMITFRLWQPIGPGEMEIWSWGLVDADADEDYKKESLAGYLRCFGISGAFEQDDAEVWQSSHHVTRGQLADQLNYNYQMGSATLEPRPDWPGPGNAYPLGYAEFPQRGFHRRWLQYMTGQI